MKLARVRALPVVLFALAGAALVALPSPANAAVTISNITTPVNGAHYTVTAPNQATPVTVAGTTNGTTGDFVDIRCYYQQNEWKDGPGNIPVQADGTFSTNTGTPGLGYGSCRLRAVPHGLPGGNPVSAYTGPVITSEYAYPEKVSSGPNAGKTFDYYLAYQSKYALNDYTSATDGGLWDSRLSRADGSSSNMLWYGNAYLRRDADPLRSMLQVDGRNAYGPYGAHSQFPDNAGFPVLSFSASRNNATGVTTIHETDPIVVCPSEAPFPPTAGSCPHYNSAGVRLERTIVTSDGGRQVQMTDVWRSTDGRQHTVNAHYGQTIEARDYSSGTVTTNVGIKLPWFGGYQTYSSATTYPGTTAVPSTIFVRDSNTAPDGDQMLPRGAIVAGFPLSAVRRKANADFELQTTLTVPRGGTRIVRHAFVIGTTEAEIAAKAAANVVALNPYRSDGVIKRKGGASFGNGVYNTSGSGQTSTAKAKRSHKATFLITVQNDGTRTTSFRIRGAGGKSGFAVKYLKGASGHASITKAVTHGRYVLANLAPGQSRVLRLVVTVKHGASIGALRSWLVLATSTNDTRSKDAVKAAVHVVR